MFNFGLYQTIISHSQLPVGTDLFPILQIYVYHIYRCSRQINSHQQSSKKRYGQKANKIKQHNKKKLHLYFMFVCLHTSLLYMLHIHIQRQIFKPSFALLLHMMCIFSFCSIFAYLPAVDVAVVVLVRFHIQLLLVVFVFCYV